MARLDFHFEKNIINATAEYSLNEDGSIKVVNRGYDIKKQEMKESVGKAKFVDSPEEGKLKVSFFGPFYAGYNVVAIDPYYKYALVAGKNHDYLWILSRETTMPENVKHEYLQKARELGYDTSKLLWTQHE
ncbi:MAG: lipocalin family protein [Tannerellaceae bacterium]|nr:lipocalin family protein [Tannerellaceae bacterium]